MTPVCPKRNMCWRWSARNRSGIKNASGWPIASLPGQPKIFSAARLYRTMVCAASTVMIASIAESSTPASSANALRSALEADAASGLAKKECGTGGLHLVKA